MSYWRVMPMFRLGRCGECIGRTSLTYTLVHARTGEVVGGGFDGTGMIVVVIVRLLLCMILLSLSPVLLPIFFIFDIIKVVKFFFD